MVFSAGPSVSPSVPDMARPVLELNQLKLRYPGGDGWTLDGLDLCLNPGETLALVGSSGCGKSTVARAVMQLLPMGTICEGGLTLTGEDPRQLDRAGLRRLRGQAAGLVFQDPMTRLNPLMPVGEHLLDTLNAHRSSTTAQWRKARALDLLERVGIGAQRFRAYPHELSGGMRQRLAIALAIALEPPLLIADEPTTALDVTIQSQILSEVQRLLAQRRTALIWITHDLTVVAGLAHRVAVMYAGHIVETGAVDDLLDTPAHPYTQGLISSIPSAVPRGERLVPISGMTPSLINLPAGCAFAPRCPQADARCQAERPWQKELTRGHALRCFHPLVQGAAS